MRSVYFPLPLPAFLSLQFPHPPLSSRVTYDSWTIPKLCTRDLFILSVLVSYCMGDWIWCLRHRIHCLVFGLSLPYKVISRVLTFWSDWSFNLKLKPMTTELAIICQWHALEPTIRYVEDRTGRFYWKAFVTRIKFQTTRKIVIFSEGGLISSLSGTLISVEV